MENGSGHWVEFPCDRATPVASCFEWDGPSACEWVENARSFVRTRPQRGQLMNAVSQRIIWRHGKGSLVSVSAAFEPDAGCIRHSNGGTASDRVAENAERPDDSVLIFGRPPRNTCFPYTAP